MVSRSESQEKRAQSRAQTGRPSRNVILVDDDSLERTALARLLRGTGYNVTAFERPADVLLTLLPTENTCLVLDIYMPEMTGVSLWKELRNGGFEVPTILITGHRDQQTTTYGEQVNAVAILYKPIEEKDLFEAIERALRLPAS
jgi:two-component system, LuxR family, response regulator FixJ